MIDNEIREIITQGMGNHNKCRVLLRKQKKEQKVEKHEIHLKEKGLDGLLNNITLLEVRASRLRNYSKMLLILSGEKD